jgi:ADP-heptose:LPS heptosyltransferase
MIASRTLSLLSNRGMLSMPEKQQPASWKSRFQPQYLAVAAEVPALLRLQRLRNQDVVSPRTVLIVNCSLIGDFILSLPAITDFMRDHPDALIDILVSPLLVPLARRLRGIRSVYQARSIFRRNTETAPSDQTLAPSYDLVVVLRLSGPAARLLARTSYRAIRTYLVPYLKYGLHLATRPGANVKQLSEFDFEVFGKHGKKEQHLRADEVFDFADAPAVDTWPERQVVVHTGSGSRIYLWPIEKWVSLIQNLHGLGKLSFIFVGGTEQEERTFEEISQRVSFPLYSVIRRYDLLKLVMLMRASRLFIGVDSGPRHLAHLLDLRSVSLLGPGPKAFQPLNRNATIIDETECRRCVTFYCPYAPSCVGKIEVETVAGACREALSTASGR